MEEHPILKVRDLGLLFSVSLALISSLDTVSSSANAEVGGTLQSLCRLTIYEPKTASPPTPTRGRLSRLGNERWISPFIYDNSISLKPQFPLQRQYV